VKVISFLTSDFVDFCWLFVDFWLNLKQMSSPVKFSISILKAFIASHGHPLFCLFTLALFPCISYCIEHKRCVVNTNCCVYSAQTSEGTRAVTLASYMALQDYWFGVGGNLQDAAEIDGDCDLWDVLCVNRCWAKCVGLWLVKYVTSEWILRYLPGKNGKLSSSLVRWHWKKKFEKVCAAS